MDPIFGPKILPIYFQDRLVEWHKIRYSWRIMVIHLIASWSQTCSIQNQLTSGKILTFSLKLNSKHLKFVNRKDKSIRFLLSRIHLDTFGSDSKARNKIRLRVEEQSSKCSTPSSLMKDSSQLSSYLIVYSPLNTKRDEESWFAH